MIVWGRQQERALKAVADWLKNPNGKQVFKFFGYAGTGKTTLAKHLAMDVKGTVLFGAYTGKAAHVLRSKGCNLATTIHQMIYLPKGTSTAELKRMERQLLDEVSENGTSSETACKLRKEILAEKEKLKKPGFSLNPDSPVRNAKLVIIDECSMVDKAMGEDLLSFGVPVLVLGDPAQLPPVKSTGYFTSGEPDFMLTEIHRQAKDDPITMLATKVRKGQALKPGTYGPNAFVLGHGQWGKEHVMEADQVLVGKNSTRASWNSRYRSLLGYDSIFPQNGDRLVCLKNNHDYGLLNGGLWNVREVQNIEDDYLYASIGAVDEKYSIDVKMHKALFQGEEVPFYEMRDAEHFDYGYALTCHKSQGSQWDSVFVYDESTVFRSSRFKWLYTAITRAATRIVIAKPS